MEERRRHRRFLISRKDIRGKMLFTKEVKVINISGGGVFVKADRRFEIGREYSIKIEYEDKVLSLEGVVVWSALSESAEGPCGSMLPIYKAGIKFTVISSEKLNDFLRYIEDDNRDVSHISRLSVTSVAPHPPSSSPAGLKD